MPTKTVETYPERKQLEAVRPDLAVFTQVTVKDDFACEQGDVLGKITSGGLYRRRTKTTVDTTAFATNSATGKVADSSLFVDGDVLKNVAGVTIGTIQSINHATRVITLTGNAGVAVADGAGVYGSDGSQVANCIADKESDGDGNTPINVIIGGYLDESELNGLDSTAKSELGGVSAANGIFKF